jgi:hypothetical protein
LGLKYVTKDHVAKFVTIEHLADLGIEVTGQTKAERDEHHHDAAQKLLDECEEKLKEELWYAAEVETIEAECKETWMQVKQQYENCIHTLDNPNRTDDEAEDAKETKKKLKHQMENKWDDQGSIPGAQRALISIETL